MQSCHGNAYGLFIYLCFSSSQSVSFVTTVSVSFVTTVSVSFVTTVSVSFVFSFFCGAEVDAREEFV